MNPSFLEASCWSVDVMNGGAGCFLVTLFFTEATVYSAPSSLASRPSASACPGISSFFPSTATSAASIIFLEPGAVNFASIDQYSLGTKALISFSLSTTSLTATD